MASRFGVSARRVASGAWNRLRAVFLPLGSRSPHPCSDQPQPFSPKPA